MANSCDTPKLYHDATSNCCRTVAASDKAKLVEAVCFRCCFDDGRLCVFLLLSSLLWLLLMDVVVDVMAPPEKYNNLFCNCCTTQRILSSNDLLDSDWPQVIFSSSLFDSFLCLQCLSSDSTSISNSDNRCVRYAALENSRWAVDDCFCCPVFQLRFPPLPAFAVSMSLLCCCNNMVRDNLMALKHRWQEVHNNAL